jgi:hypothetical protein
MSYLHDGTDNQNCLVLISSPVELWVDFKSFRVEATKCLMFNILIVNCKKKSGMS